MSAVVKTLPAVTMLDLLTVVNSSPEFIDFERIVSALIDAGLDLSGLDPHDCTFDSVRKRAVLCGFIDLRTKGRGKKFWFGASITKHGAEELERLQHAERTKTARGVANNTLSDILADIGALA